MALLADKKLLITGVLSNRSIAYGIAKACAREGATLAFTYVNDDLKDRVAKIAAEFGACPLYRCDVASDGDIAALFENLRREWNELLDTGRANNFIIAAERLNRPFVINWGFPMRYLSAVDALRRAGVDLWWLHSDRGQAKTAFIEREKKKPEHERIPVECFDRQMDEIEQHWSRIEQIFGKNVVDGLKPDGSQRTPDELWAEIDARTNK